MNILDEIVRHKRGEVERRKETVSPAQVQEEAQNSPLPMDFLRGLEQSPSRPALIAEIKQRSPSRGQLLPGEFDPLQLAQVYRQNGAAALSVLTDEKYFGGCLDDLRSLVAQSPRLPILRKDFILDPYQVYEARAAGADAILLIVACLAPNSLQELHDLARSLDMVPLVEVHAETELQAALRCDPLLIGINNRNLQDFSVRLETTLRLRSRIPPGVRVVSESGIHTASDVRRLSTLDVDAILVGEALVTSTDVAGKVREFTQIGRWA